MGVLKNRIDFVAFVSVKGANPNGDPLTGNMPRQDRKGYGEISQECIKRKLRNRMIDMGQDVFVVSADKATDGLKSIQARVVAAVGKPDKDSDAYKKKVCEKFIDARAFGGLLAWSGKGDGSGDPVPILGPVTISLVKSLDPVLIDSMQITKSVNRVDSEKRGSDTMGMRHYVEFGVYRIEGSIKVQAAELTGFSEEDAEVLKECLRTLFVNDASSARPAGSMEVLKVYWFEHGCAIGDCSVGAVYRSVTAEKLCDGMPESVDDYKFSVVVPAGVSLTELEGM